MLKRLLFAAAVLTGLLTLGAAVPVTTVELGCGRGAVAVAPEATPLVQDSDYRRAEGDSYLTYPEWYIVHAYADLAAVTRHSSESAYDYGQPIGTFWRSLCQVTATARTVGPVTLDQRVTDYIIGLSFTLEMAVQGAYERTIGAVTAWTRGPAKTPEDAFNQRFLDDYAAFLRQTPWYRYPFKAELLRFWRETPWSFDAPARSLERRVALSTEYGIKGLYAVAIGSLAGFSPADLSIETVVTGPDAASVSGVALVRELGDGKRLVRTPRYEAYSDILRAWAKTDTAVVEIAGNARILLTVLAPIGTEIETAHATPIFRIPIQSKPGWERVGLDTQTPAIISVIRDVEARGVVFEHAYDY